MKINHLLIFMSLCVMFLIVYYIVYFTCDMSGYYVWRLKSKKEAYNTFALRAMDSLENNYSTIVINDKLDEIGLDNLNDSLGLNIKEYHLVVWKNKLDTKENYLSLNLGYNYEYHYYPNGHKEKRSHYYFQMFEFWIIDAHWEISKDHDFI